MNDPRNDEQYDNRLAEVFLAHESLAPDAGEVLANANQRARGARRRRLALRATGVSVLGAGLVAGAIGVPALLNRHAPDTTLTSIQPASDGGTPATASATPTPSLSPTTAETYSADEARAEYFAAGYDYSDAQALGGLWNETDITQIKTQAGQKLLAGQTLPIRPSSPSGADDVTAAQAADTTAFFDAGYTYDDAVQLAQLWNDPDAYHAKIQGGQKLLAGQTLPIQPSGTAQSVEQRDIDTFLATGYDYTDAQQLAQLWNETDITHVKAQAGQKLVNGQSLPIHPSGQPS